MAEILALIMLAFLGLFAMFGLIDALAFLKFYKREGVDKTASYLNWIFVKWVTAQDPKLVERHPYVSLDLRETLRVRKDDGRIT